VIKLGQRGGLALDEFKSEETEPLPRLRAYLQQLDLNSDRDLQELLEAVEQSMGSAGREDGTGTGKAGAQDDTDDPDDAELQRMLQGIKGLSSDDAARIAKFVKDSALPANGIDVPAQSSGRADPMRRSNPAMDSRTVARINEIAPGFSSIKVGVF
jgi:hypothetical protein